MTEAQNGAHIEDVVNVLVKEPTLDQEGGETTEAAKVTGEQEEGTGSIKDDVSEPDSGISGVTPSDVTSRNTSISISRRTITTTTEVRRVSSNASLRLPGKSGGSRARSRDSSSTHDGDESTPDFISALAASDQVPRRSTIQSENLPPEAEEKLEKQWTHLHKSSKSQKDDFAQKLLNKKLGLSDQRIEITSKRNRSNSSAASDRSSERKNRSRNRAISINQARANANLKPQNKAEEQQSEKDVEEEPQNEKTETEETGTAPNQQQKDTEPSRDAETPQPGPSLESAATTLQPGTTSQAANQNTDTENIPRKDETKKDQEMKPREQIEDNVAEPALDETNDNSPQQVGEPPKKVEEEEASRALEEAAAVRSEPAVGSVPVTTQPGVGDSPRKALEDRELTESREQGCCARMFCCCRV